METRQGPHDSRHHFTRRRIASRFAERLIVNRDNGDARRRGTRAGKKEAPVEGQIFDPVQRGSETVDLQSAEGGAEEERRDEKDARQEPGRPRPFSRHSLAETGKKRPDPFVRPHVPQQDVSVGVMSTPCPSLRTTNRFKRRLVTATTP